MIFRSELLDTLGDGLIYFFQSFLSWKTPYFWKKILGTLEDVLRNYFFKIEIGSVWSWVGSVEGYRWVGKISFGVKKQAWEANTRDKHV